MKRLCALLLALTLFFASALAESAPDTAALDASLRKILKRHGAVSATVLCGIHGQQLYQINYGMKDRKQQLPVDENTYFKIASVSKMVTAIRVMQLVEEGKLSLDEDISTYFGYKVVNPYYPKNPVTLRTLMTHTSSLRTNGGYRKTSSLLSEMLDSGVKRQSGNFNKEKPGSVYRYSNFGAGVMGSLMEKVTGENINDIIQELFKPLGIEAGYYPSLLNEADIQNQYHRGNKTFISKRRVIAEDTYDGLCSPDTHYRVCYGRVYIRGKDLLRLGMMLCDGGILEGQRVLKEETVQEMMASQKGKGAVTVDSPYGLCVNRMTNLVRGKMIYGHQGLLDDQVYNLYFEPESGFVFVMMGNGINSSMSDHIAVVSRNCFKVLWDAYVGEGVAH